METEVLKMVIDAVSEIGELGVWGLVAYLATTLLLSLIKFGTVLVIVYWIVRGIASAVAMNASMFSDSFMKQVRDHYSLGPKGVLSDAERERVRAKIKEIVREDMDRPK